MIESPLNHSNLDVSFCQGETGFPGLPGCKGSPGFDVSYFLYPLYFGIMGFGKFGPTLVILTLPNGQPIVNSFDLFAQSVVGHLFGAHGDLG